MRSRHLRPGFFSNEDLLGLPPLTRIFFIGLWCQADREGRLLDQPGRLKNLILPADACSGEEMLAQLASTGTPPLIVRYQVGTDRLIWIPRFRVQQGRGIHPHEAQSLLPRCDQDDCSAQEDTIGTPKRTNGTQCRALTSSSSLPSSPSREEGGKGEQKEEEVQERSGEIPVPQTVLQVPLPDALKTEAFWAHWLAYLRYRIDVGKPYRPQGAAWQLARLAKWGPERACAAIAHTMAQEYLGIVEESGTAAGKPEKKSRAQIIQEDNDEWLRQQSSTGPGSTTTPSASASRPPIPPS